MILRINHLRYGAYEQKNTCDGRKMNSNEISHISPGHLLSALSSSPHDPRLGQDGSCEKFEKLGSPLPSGDATRSILRPGIVYLMARVES